MARVLLVYASRHGQTEAIAQHVALLLQNWGNLVDIVDANVPPPALPMLTYDAFVVAAAVNYGRHLRPMEEFVRKHQFELRTAPSAFLSVSASSASQDTKSREQAARCIDGFIRDTGWKPTVSLAVAGAMKYTRYPWLMKIMLRSIVRRSGGDHCDDVDIRRDYEYTDWKTVDKFVQGFLRTEVCAPKALLL